MCKRHAARGGHRHLHRCVSDRSFEFDRSETSPFSTRFVPFRPSSFEREEAHRNPTVASSSTVAHPKDRKDRWEFPVHTVPMGSRGWKRASRETEALDPRSPISRRGVLDLREGHIGRILCGTCIEGTQHCSRRGPSADIARLKRSRTKHGH